MDICRYQTKCYCNILIFIAQVIWNVNYYSLLRANLLLRLLLVPAVIKITSSHPSDGWIITCPASVCFFKTHVSLPHHSISIFCLPPDILQPASKSHVLQIRPNHPNLRSSFLFLTFATPALVLISPSLIHSALLTPNINRSIIIPVTSISCSSAFFNR